ncbi:class I SAM-dependent methyltransferase [Candidatus Venteria ishoeyi]|uniref:Bifunctional 3-demethylubiquinone-9 3-methyltransferase/ 2-octaprenyl-6-hydroxy phenol methylase n=1 Tax=Candidatus Venteria ishoeyi TaxID=1899563 RepID=A0A1H6F681_9GAMM|nr:class I SAM-dependent methyltransferase [Candidatus Venteria ishoeyi]SEH05622.1 Uncharacterised protein [Candidatus Venteria ishoeyi]
MSSQLHKISECEVCGNQHLASVLNLGSHPMCDDLVPIGDSRVCKEYPIEIMFCEKCLTAHQHYQVPKQELFPSSYHYRSRFTKDVLDGMNRLVQSCEYKFGSLHGKKVLDVGCNDGSLLDFFKQKNASTLGIEPTDAYLDAKNKGHLAFNQFISPEVANQIINAYGKVDFITFTNVFAHIESLNEVLASLKILSSPDTVIIIENHYLGSILDGCQFDTFYHEHPRTYSYTSFTFIAKLLGMDLLDVEFPARYGGNIRVFLGNKQVNVKSSTNLTELSNREKKIIYKFKSLNEKIEAWKSEKKNILTQKVEKYGALKAKAFPGRAAILIKLLDLDESFISNVYEKPGSLKIGYYVPGTRIPICSDDDFLRLKDKPSVLLNLAWHISDEIQSYMEKVGYTGQVIDIFEKS